MRNFNKKYLNENFFNDMDDEEISQAAVNDASTEDDFSNANEIGIDSYHYMIDVKIIGVPPEMRRNIDAYSMMLQPLQKKLSYIFKNIDAFEDTGKIIFALDDAYFNTRLDSVWKLRNFNLQKIEPSVNEYNGIPIYNDPEILKQDKRVRDCNHFNAKVGVDIDIKPEDWYKFPLQLFSIVNRALKMLYPYTKMKVFSIRITDNKHTTPSGKPVSCQMAANKLRDMENRKNDKSMKRTLDSLYFVLFRNSHAPKKYVDDFFKVGEYSYDMLEVLRILDIKDIKSVWLDEDDNCIRVTIPKDVKLKISWIYTCGRDLEAIKMRSKKHILIDIEGTLTFQSGDTDANKKFFSFLGHNINEMRISISSFKDEQPVVDLTWFYIRKLRITIPAARSEWEVKRHINKPRPIVRYDKDNIGELKIFDHFDEVR